MKGDTMNTSKFLSRERRISKAEHGGILERWAYGRALLAFKGARKQLPHGLASDLIREATAAGLALSQREIRYRVACAEAYPTRAEVGTAVQTFGTWAALRDAGFPVIEDTEDALVLDLDPDPDPTWSQEPLADDLFPDQVLVDRQHVSLADVPLGAFLAYADTCAAVTARFAQRDATRRKRLGELIAAAQGDLRVTYGQAIAAMQQRAA